MSTLDPRRHHKSHLQNLNEPFIPEIPHHVQSVPKQIANTVYQYFSLADPLGRTTKHQNSYDATAPLHTIAALIATTGNLSGVVSPTCATIAPVWSYEDQGDVGGGSGGRRLSRYTRQEAVEDPKSKKRAEEQGSEDDHYDRRVRRRRHAKERRHQHESNRRERERDRERPTKEQGRARSASTSADREEASVEDTDHQPENEAQVNHNAPAPDDEHLDVIAEEGTNEIIRTEGASEPAYRAEYAPGEKHNRIRTPEGSPRPKSSRTLNEMDEDDSFPFEDDDGGTEVDLEYEGERKKKRKGQYAGWVGSKRGERVQQEIYIKRNRSTQTQTRDFIVRLANAHMMFGSPTHRLESQLESTCRILELDAHFF